MDYLKRAEEVRNLNRAQLKAVVANMTLEGVTPVEIVVLTMRQVGLQEMGLQLILLDNYIKNLREDPPVDDAAALQHFFYAIEFVMFETKSKVGNTSTLRYQLINPDYSPPILTEEDKREIKDTVRDAVLAASKPKDVVIYIEGYDRDDPVRVLHNGNQIGYATYDEHASAGMEAVQEMGEALAKSLGVEMITINTATEEYEADCKALGLDPEEYR